MRNQLFDLQLLLQNTQHGTAENVLVKVDVPKGVFVMDEPEGKFTQMVAGDKKSLVYRMAINNQYQGDIIPIKVKIIKMSSYYSVFLQIKTSEEMTIKEYIAYEKKIK